MAKWLFHASFTPKIDVKVDIARKRLIAEIAPAQRAQLLGDLIDEVDLLQVIGR